MVIDNPTNEKMKEYYDNLLKYIEKEHSFVKTLYLDLGVKIVRLLCYSEEFIPHIEKQLDYTLRTSADKYDATIIIWKENNIKQIHKFISSDFDLRNNLRLRAEMIVRKQLSIFHTKFSKTKPLLKINYRENNISYYYEENETYFYGVDNLEPEEFIKQGHIFVQTLNDILKTENTNLVHGACVGLNNEGILLCARGQRGKSTLAVLAMLEGFEYVSDDYLTLERVGDNLYTYPIYSIITLSPRMYNELYDKLEGTRFVSNNARKDKYVINISNFHNRFKKKYPIKLCMFPEIVSDKEPSVKECSIQEKGRAIVHIIHSTINQMGDRHDIKTIQKLIGMIKDFKFYKIYLCNDIYKNVECLREFLQDYSNRPQKDKLKEGV